jgi:phage gpG-like protein
MSTTVNIDLGVGELRLTQDMAGSFEIMRAAIDTVRARASDVSPAFRAFRPVWWENERLIFTAQGIPGWPSLSPAYAQRKAKIAPGKSMLRLTDRLYQSLTSQTGDSVYTVEPRSLLMGTTVPYSGFHTSGTRRMPARRHVHLLPEYWQKLNAAVFEFIIDPFRQQER